MDVAKLKTWAKANRGKIAAGAAGVAAVILLAARNRGRGPDTSTITPQQIPITDATTGAGGDTAGSGLVDALAQIAQQQATGFSALADNQAGQANVIYDSIAGITAAQQQGTSSISALLAQQAAAQQKSIEALTKQITAATTAAKKKEPATPAAPKKAAEPAKKKAEPAPAKKTTKTTKVTVKSGDSLSKIAAANGITTKQIIKLNPQIANPNLIYAGQKVVVKK